MNSVDNIEGMRARFLQFADSMHLSERGFCKRCGLSDSYTRTFKGKPSLKTKRLIEEAFPALNLDWVETGRGKMLKPVDNSISMSNVKAENVAGRDINIGNIPMSTREQIASLKAELAAKQEQLDAQSKLIDRLMKMLEAK